MLVVIVMIVNNGDDNDCVGGMVVTIMKVVSISIMVMVTRVLVAIARLCFLN